MEHDKDIWYEQAGLYLLAREIKRYTLSVQEITQHISVWSVYVSTYVGIKMTVHVYNSNYSHNTIIPRYLESWEHFLRLWVLYCMAHPVLLTY